MGVLSNPHAAVRGSSHRLRIQSASSYLACGTFELYSFEVAQSWQRTLKDAER